MIDRIRSVMQTESLVKRVLKRLTEQNQKINTLSKETSSLRTEMGGLSKCAKDVAAKQEKALKDFTAVVEKIGAESVKLHASVTQFSIQNSKAAQKVVEQLRTDISHFTDVLRTDVHSFDQLKAEVDSIRAQLDRTRVEIKRFTEISKTLKSSDFELTKYIRKVQEMDRDKLALMKKIDSLERLVAAARRNR